MIIIMTPLFFLRRRRRRQIMLIRILVPLLMMLICAAAAAGAGSASPTLGSSSSTRRRRRRRRSLLSLLSAALREDDDGDDPLVDWLDRLRVDVPDQSFSAKLLTVHIEGLHCTHFSVQHIDSELLLSSSSQQQQQTQTQQPTQQQAIRVGVRQVAATCQGKYRATGGARGTIHARLTTTNSFADDDDPQQAVEWTVAVLDNPNTTTTTTTTATSTTTSFREPGSVQTQSCATALRLTDLHFSGSYSAKLIDIFRDSIEHHANSAIAKQICPVIEAKVDPLLSSYLRRAVAWLRPYYQQQDQNATRRATPSDAKPVLEDWMRILSDAGSRYDDEEEEEDSETTIDFLQDLPFLTHVLRSINSFVANHLDRGFLHLPPADDDSTNNATNSTTFCQSAECGGFLFKGINGAAREMLESWTTNDSWTLPVPPVHLHLVLPQYAAIGLHVERVTVGGRGLYKWTNVTVLQPVASSSSSSSNSSLFQTGLETAGAVSVAAHMVVNVSSVPGGRFKNEHSLTESFVIQVNTTSFDVALDLALQLDRESFRRVTVGHLVALLQKLLLDKTAELPTASVSVTPEEACVLDSIRSLTVEGLSATLDLSHFSIAPAPPNSNSNESSWLDEPPPTSSNSDQLEQDLDVLLSNVVQLFLGGYRPLVTASIQGLVRGPGQARLNDFLASSMDMASKNLTANCTIDESVEPRWINFTEIRLLQQLNALLQEEDILSKINQYMDCTANLINRVIEQKLFMDISPFELVDSASVVEPLLDSIASPTSTLRLRQLRFEHPGNLRRLEIFSPVKDGKHLESGLSIQSNSSNLQPQFSLSFDLDYIPLNLAAEINVTLHLDQIDWIGGSILRVDSNALAKMALMEPLSRGQCLVVPADQVELYDSKTRLGRFQTIVQASITTSTKSTTDVDASQTIAFDSTNYPDVQATASTLFVWLVNTVCDASNGFIRAAVAHAPSQCYRESYESNTEDDEEETIGFDTNTLFLILAAVYIFVQPTILLMKRPREAARQEQEDGPNEERDLAEPLLHPRYSDETTQVQIPPVRKPASLMFHSKVPEIARHLIPILILITIAMLLASNLNTGASVIAVVSQADKSFRLPSLFDFGLYNTAKEMLQAKIYPLFFLVVGFSGIWPYAKLLLMLAAWVVPESVLSKDSRGELLLKLDALSKFSLVDTYVLVVMLVAFRFHIELIGDTVLDVYVGPKSGFYGFLLATSASLIIGHVLVFYHRQTELHLEFDDGYSYSLFNYEFVLLDGSRRRLSQNSKRLFVVLLFTSIVLLGFGVSQESFRFEFGGLAGLALGEERVTNYSLLSLGAAIPKSVERPAGVAVYVLQVAFYFYAVVTPFAALFFLLLILVFPLTLRRQIQILTVAEIANAWSAVEVFALSIIAALLEISTFASFIIGSRCDIIDEILKDYDTVGVDTCYTVESTVTWRAVFLVLGVVLNSGWVSLVLRLVHISLHERIEGSEHCRSPSLVQRMAGWRFTSWMIESEVAEDLNEEAGPPVFTEEMISAPAHQESYGFDTAWKEAAERDPSWREWRDATSVT